MSLYEAIKEVSEQEKEALATEAGVNDDAAAAAGDEPKDKGNTGGNKPDDTAPERGAAPNPTKQDEKEPAAPAEGETRDGKGRFKKGEKPEGADKGGKEGSGEKKEGAAPAAEGKTEELTPEAYARLRRELAAEKRRREAAEARVPQAPTQPQPGPAHAAAPPKANDPLGQEPDPNLDPEGHTRWKLAKAEKALDDLNQWRETQERQTNRTVAEKRAIEAYEKYENDFSPTVQDYQDVTTWGVNQIASSIRVLRPDLKGEKLSEAIRFEVLRRAADYEKQGYDPAEQFYHDCKAWGYKPAEAAPAEKPAAPEKPARPSIKDVAKNQRRAASSMTPGGRNGNAPMSRSAALSGDMTLAEWSKLSPSQLREMESQESA